MDALPSLPPFGFSPSGASTSISIPSVFGFQFASVSGFVPVGCCCCWLNELIDLGVMFPGVGDRGAYGSTYCPPCGGYCALASRPWVDATDGARGRPAVGGNDEGGGGPRAGDLNPPLPAVAASSDWGADECPTRP